MKKTISILGVLIFMFSVFSITVLGASSPNYATSTERYQLYYDGYIQVQPSYNENGYHAANGYIRYINGRDGDTGRLYTATGKSQYDSTIYSRSYRYYDTLDPFAPQVKFYYGFSWVAHGSALWPA